MIGESANLWGRTGDEELGEKEGSLSNVRMRIPKAAKIIDNETPEKIVEIHTLFPHFLLLKTDSANCFAFLMYEGMDP